MKYRFNFPISAAHAEKPRYTFDRRGIEERANYETFCTLRHAYTDTVPFRKALVHQYRCAVDVFGRKARVADIVSSGVYNDIKDEKDSCKRDLMWRAERERLRAALNAALLERDAAAAKSYGEQSEALSLVYRSAGKHKRPRPRLNDFEWIERVGPLPEPFDEK